MKFTAPLVTALAIAACVYSTASMAESGTPSRQEVGPSASGEVVSNDDVRVNDYARYLMVVDGMSRVRAIAEAKGHNEVPSQKVAQKNDLGSYGRYLMVVDGMSHSEALAAAANQDHPEATRSLAIR